MSKEKAKKQEQDSPVKKEKAKKKEQDTQGKKEKEKGKKKEQDAPAKKEKAKKTERDAPAMKEKGRNEEVKVDEDVPGAQNHVKILHLVWFGTGKPGKQDALFLKMWAGLSDVKFGWEVNLWSDGPERDWIPEGVRYRNIEEIEGQMCTAMGADEWRMMIQIIKDESTPTKVSKKPKKGTPEATLKIVQDMTMDEGAERRSLGNGANYAAASDIVRSAVLYCFGGFYTDMASHPGSYDGGLAIGEAATVGKASLASKLEKFITVADPKPGTTTTVLWSAQTRPYLVNNAFLGSSSPRNPFYLYFLKSMYNMYDKLVYNPDVDSAAAFFEAKGRGENKVDAAALQQRLKCEAGFMVTMKRLACRGMTLFTTGPYLLRCCLFYFFHENDGREAPEIPTVSAVCHYVLEMEAGDVHANSVKQKEDIEKKSKRENRQVWYEVQNKRFQKIQRGSWDQENVPGYFLDIYGQNAKERILWRTTPDGVKTVVKHLRAKVEGALVANHLDKFLRKSAFAGSGDGQEVSYFIRRPDKEVVLAFGENGYKDFLVFCQLREIENTLNLYNKLCDLEPKHNKFQLYMKSVDKIWELFLKPGAKLAVVQEMNVKTFGGLSDAVAAFKAMHDKYWQKGAAISDDEDD